MRKKLSELQAWITSIRRDQTSVRAKAHKVEWDEKFGLVKINPLADWTSEQVWTYIRRHKVPYNVLHDRNYPSIGCTHCTRAVQAGRGSPRRPLVGHAEDGMRAAHPALAESAADSSGYFGQPGGERRPRPQQRGRSSETRCRDGVCPSQRNKGCRQRNPLYSLS